MGKVGSALNTLLDHVDSALDARHRSEQQVRQFVADASHELRTPLSTIHGYAELSRRTPEERRVSQAMDKVETEATRMSALVADMLLLARLDSGRPLDREEVDVTRLLLEAVADAQRGRARANWRLDLPEEPVTVVGDEHRLHQVVTNLITTPAGTPRRDHGHGRRTSAPGRGRGRPDRGARQRSRHPPRLVTDGSSSGSPAATTSRTRASGGAGLGLSLVTARSPGHHGGFASDGEPPRRHDVHPELPALRSQTAAQSGHTVLAERLTTLAS